VCLVLQAADDTGNRTLYENREIFAGPLAYVIEGLFEAGLQGGVRYAGGRDDSEDIVGRVTDWPI